jgi:hypothetical protein
MRFPLVLLLLGGCATAAAPPFIERVMPARVHVAEDFETEIEKRWWLAGQVEVEGGNRVCKGTESKDFDDKMGVPGKRYTAVIFNPVPGPPMGLNTRLAFRYRLMGTDTLRVQLFSLSNNYHRRLLLPGLPQGEWRDACVDMTQMRRPDGTGGPLSDGERIDDIQFYVDPKAQLWIDDIVLYDHAETMRGAFPRRVIFAGGFDTGAQGKEWPGEFDIVAHEKPRTWKHARSRNGVLRVDLRGERPAASGRVSYSVRTRGGASLTIGSTKYSIPPTPAWTSYDNSFESSGPLKEVLFTGDLDIDDLLIYQP